MISSISPVVNVTIGFLFFLSVAILNPVQAQNSSLIQTNQSHIYIPPTISKEAQQALKNFKSDLIVSNLPQPDDLEDWKQLSQQREINRTAGSKGVIDSYQANTTYTRIGNANVIDIKPKNWIDNHKVLVYTHGGGYTQLSANSTLGGALAVANITGLRIISIDYTLAPFSKWNKTTDQVISVIRDLKDKQGYSLNNVAMFGDSAGGDITLGSLLKMRDAGIGMPVAVVVFSPNTDLTLSGDTLFTLRNADPVLDVNETKMLITAYANPSDQKIPYASPIYGNFSKGFPPTLIQVGTKEILLSDSVRLYQALDQAGIPVKLDVYEGMPHVFQGYLADTPESKIAISKMNDFLKEYLKY